MKFTRKLFLLKFRSSSSNVRFYKNDGRGRFFDEIEFKAHGLARQSFYKNQHLREVEKWSDSFKIIESISQHPSNRTDEEYSDHRKLADLIEKSELKLLMEKLSTGPVLTASLNDLCDVILLAIDSDEGENYIRDNFLENWFKSLDQYLWSGIDKTQKLTSVLSKMSNFRQVFVEKLGWSRVEKIVSVILDDKLSIRTKHFHTLVYGLSNLYSGYGLNGQPDPMSSELRQKLTDWLSFYVKTFAETSTQSSKFAMVATLKTLNQPLLCPQPDALVSSQFMNFFIEEFERAEEQDKLNTAFEIVTYCYKVSVVLRQFFGAEMSREFWAIWARRCRKALSNLSSTDENLKPKRMALYIGHYVITVVEHNLVDEYEKAKTDLDPIVKMYARFYRKSDINDIIYRLNQPTVTFDKTHWMKQFYAPPKL